jgi:hypothetical protein
MCSLIYTIFSHIYKLQQSEYYWTTEDLSTAQKAMFVGLLDIILDIFVQDGIQ